jgi:hypothetical protein
MIEEFGLLVVFNARNPFRSWRLESHEIVRSIFVNHRRRSMLFAPTGAASAVNNLRLMPALVQ